MDMCFDIPVATVSFLSGCTVLAMTVSSLLKSRNGDVVIEKVRGTSLGAGAAVGGVAGKEMFEIIKAAGGNAVSLIQQVLMVLIDTKTAALYSLYIILFSQSASLLNTLLRGNIPEFEPSMLLVMVAGGIMGGIFRAVWDGKCLFYDGKVLAFSADSWYDRKNFLFYTDFTEELS